MAEFVSRGLSHRVLDNLQGYRPFAPFIVGAAAGGIGAYAATHTELDNPLLAYVPAAVLVASVLQEYVIDPLFGNKK